MKLDKALHILKRSNLIVENDWEDIVKQEARRADDEAYMNLSDLLFNQPPEAM